MAKSYQNCQSYRRFGLKRWLSGRQLKAQPWRRCELIVVVKVHLTAGVVAWMFSSRTKCQSHGSTGQWISYASNELFWSCREPQKEHGQLTCTAVQLSIAVVVAVAVAAAAARAPAPAAVADAAIAVVAAAMVPTTVPANAAAALTFVVVPEAPKTDKLLGAVARAVVMSVETAEGMYMVISVRALAPGTSIEAVPLPMSHHQL